MLTLITPTEDALRCPLSLHEKTTLAGSVVLGLLSFAVRW